MQSPRLCASVVILVTLATSASQAQSRTPELVSVQLIWDQAPHNAFTDLVRFQEEWFCTFREGDGHVGGDGKIRVLTSADGDKWTSAALLAEEGIDLRDPKLSVTVDNQLMLVAGGSVYGGTTTLKAMQPRVSFSFDGRTWTTPRRVLEEGHWLWRVTWHEGRAYGVSYRVPKPYGAEAPPTADWEVTLVASDDGVNFTPVTRLDVPGKPNETTLRVLANGDMLALMRRDGGNTRGWIGLSRPPFYRQWTWKEAGMRLGGPEFLRVARSIPVGRHARVHRPAQEGVRPQGPQHGPGPPDARIDRAAAVVAQRRRHQLSRPRLARQPAVDELLLVAREEIEHLSGEDPAGGIGAA